MFRSIDITSKALDASILRIEVLTNNISNVETPNFRREDVSFETHFSKALAEKGASGMNIDELEPTVYTDHANFTNRIDGNNVDIDVEMAEVAKTQLRYDTLIQRTNAQIGRYTYILQNLK